MQDFQLITVAKHLVKALSDKVKVEEIYIGGGREMEQWNANVSAVSFSDRR